MKMEQAKCGSGEPRLFGYARVSSREQNLDRQLDAFWASGKEGRFSSGADLIAAAAAS